jgi:biotin carboxyl carrier protein
MEEKKEHLQYTHITIDDIEYKTTINTKYSRRKPFVPHNPKIMVAFIPGTVRKLMVKSKDKVKKGDPLLILDAMKMNNQIYSPFTGTIKEVFVKEGEMVGKNLPLLEFK